MPDDITPASTGAEATPDLSTPADKDPVEALTEGQEPEAELSDEDKVKAAAAEAAKKKEPVRNKRKLKLKVDGKEIEEEIDLDDNDYLTRQIQLAKAAQKRMGEYAQLEKQVKGFLEDLRKNPRKVLSDPNIGIDVKALAAEVIEAEINDSKKTPEQLEKEKLETKLKEIEEERKKEKDDYQKREFERLQSQAYERYDAQLTSALDKSDLPKSPYVIKKMADYMLMGLQEGLDVTPEDVVPLVREEMTNDLKEMFAVMPDEVIEAIVGKDVLTRLRKKNVAKAKSSPPTPMQKSVQDTGGKDTSKSDKTPKKQTFRDFFGV